MIRITAPLALLAALGACATPNAPTKSASDVERSFEEAAYLSTRPFTDTADLPTGRVTYKGEVGADVSGDINGAILGDMTMNVRFGDNSVNGTIDNINLIDPDGRPDQRMGGDLTIDGVESAGRLDAFAYGDLTVVNDGITQESDVLLTMEGDVVDDRGTADAIFGSVRGDGIGEFSFEADGVFYGIAE
ncbi:MAG: hypothetical protein ACSHW1_16380 [Yoonia sp.]|uniref:hypothetical protein n=1 Tax=Yoonia sp. TaxID=2212373 RepID=UPI003EFB2B74